MNPIFFPIAFGKNAPSCPEIALLFMLRQISRFKNFQFLHSLPAIQIALRLNETFPLDVVSAFDYVEKHLKKAFHDIRLGAKMKIFLTFFLIQTFSSQDPVRLFLECVQSSSNLI